MAEPGIPDYPVTCPYNSSHRIAQSRLQKHLVKCEKNYPPNYKIACPYNATHRLFESDLAKHILSCPDRQYMDRSVWDIPRHGHGSIKSFHDMEDRSMIECEESWDDDFTANSSIASVCRFEMPSSPPKIVSEPSFRMSAGLNSQRASSRPPRGRPEALMMDQSEDSAVEDIESVTSAQGIGRGKPWAERNTRLLELIGRGRGSRKLLN